MQCLFLTSLISLLLLNVSSVSAEQSVLYYILDGSGSMWGRVEGEMKIQAAKRVMSELIDQTPDNIHGGLMVYGHRRKGDCADIEEILPIGAVDKAAAKARVQRISPRGMTPISDSIIRASNKLKGLEYQATIVLVSDGIETCDKDPCKVVKSLKESGAKFVMHVVGFGVKDAADQQLACIAKEGGGEYFNTKNAADLLDSLNKIKQSVVEKKVIKIKAVATPIPATPEPTATPKVITQKISSTSKSIRIKAKGPGRVVPVYDSWLKAPRYWKLVNPETGEEKASFGGSLDQQLVPPGEYQALWRQDEHGSSEVVLSEVVLVESGEKTELVLKTGIRLALPTWVKTPRFWGLRRPGEEKELASFNIMDAQLVPAGDYQLVWRQSEHGSATAVLAEIKIKPDVLNEVELSTGFNLIRADWVPEQVKYWGLQDLETEKWAAWFAETFDPQLVPAGKYKLIYRKSEHGSSDSDLGIVEVSSGQMNEFAMNTGVKLVAPAEIKNPYRIEYIELDASGKEVRTVSQSGNFEAMPLKPGTYKITYWQSEHGSKPVTLVDSFELPAGNLVEIEL